MKGRDLAYTPNIGVAEKLYITIFGVPISGLRIRLRRILPHAKIKSGRILDAGCGRGVFCYELAKLNPNAEIIGVDLDDEQLKINEIISNKAHLKNIKFMKADIQRLDFFNEFDLILSIDNLEHLEDDGKGIEGLYRALKPGGRLIVHVPGYERIWPVFRFKTNFDVPGHYRPGYYKHEIVLKLADHGFIVDEAHYTYGWLETISNNISYVITQAEAKNKHIYALFFPILNLISWLGKWSKPNLGAGVMVICRKPNIGENRETSFS